MKDKNIANDSKCDRIFVLQEQETRSLKRKKSSKKEQFFYIEILNPFNKEHHG